ncbi:hypothetical protein GCM10027578_23000 [Spirosoma luteolum]
MNRSLPYLFWAGLLLLGCSSGQTALRRGDFDKAVAQAASRLQSGHGLTKRGRRLAPLVLRNAFVQAYASHQTRIRDLTSDTSPPFRWETVVTHYQALQTLTDNARTCGPCAGWLAAYPADYGSPIRETRQLAAADRYQAAELAFAYRETDRRAARDAYSHYRRADEWVPGYQQASTKAQEAFAYALLRVAVEPVSAGPLLTGSDRATLQRAILRSLNPEPAPFVRLYLPAQVQASVFDGAPVVDGFGIAQAVQLRVTDLDSYHDNVTSSSSTVYSNQPYKVGEKKINDSTRVDILEKVSGTLTVHTRTVRADMQLHLRGLETASGRALWQEPVTASRSWTTSWETFTGDERALNGHTLATASLLVPSRWQLFDGLCDDMASSVRQRLERVYRAQEQD